MGNIHATTLKQFENMLTNENQILINDSFKMEWIYNIEKARNILFIVFLGSENVAYIRKN